MIGPTNSLNPGASLASTAVADPNVGRDTAFLAVLDQKIGSSADAHDSTGSGKTRASDRQDPRGTIAGAGLNMAHNPTAMAVADLSSPAPVKPTVASAEQTQTAPSRPTASESRGQTPRSARSNDEGRADISPRPAPTTSLADRPATPAAMPRDQAPTTTGAATPNRAPSSPSGPSNSKSGAAPVSAARAPAQAPPGAVQAAGKIGAAAAPRSQSSGSPTVPTAIKAAAVLDKVSRAIGKQPTTSARLAPEEEKVAAQAARGLAAALRQGGGSVTLRLQPEALGDLKVKLDLTGSKVGASFEVGSEQARKLLDTTLTTLRSALEARGLEVDRLEIRIADRPGHTPQSQDAGHAFGGAEHGGAGSGDRGTPERDAPGHGAGFGFGMERSPPPAPLETGQAHGARPGPGSMVIQTGGVPLMRVRLDAVA